MTEVTAMLYIAGAIMMGLNDAVPMISVGVAFYVIFAVAGA